jgi:nucleoside-diphosphate-sugar epimerase
MRVLITGASGYVGSATATRMLGAGIQVVGLSRKPCLVIPENDQAIFDISVPGVAAEIVRNVSPCEAIVHAAASLDHDLFAPGVSLANCLGTQEMLKLASLWKSYFIYISSVPVIGMPRNLPITEDHPVAPPSAYHASKLFGEHLVRLASEQGIRGATLRLTSPVGPAMPPGRIFSVFVSHAAKSKPIQLAGKGGRRQDYVDVRDVARAIEKCLAARSQGIYNVASGRAVSNLDLARRCVAVLGSSSAVEFNGRPDAQESWNWDVSIARANQDFGFQPQFSLEDSIRDLATEYAGSHP